MLYPHMYTSSLKAADVRDSLLAIKAVLYTLAFGPRVTLYLPLPLLIYSTYCE